MKLFLTGFGTVGQGFAELLLEKQSHLQERYGLEYRVVGIADLKYGNIFSPTEIDLKQALNVVQAGKAFADEGLPIVSEPTEILIAKKDYDIFIELTPTNLQTGEPATTFIRTALESGHHVITTNKGPCALHLNELRQLAIQKSVQFRYEGTVLAGTPLLNLIDYNLAGLSIKKLEGIVNGTCNFILTRMEEGLPYPEALKEAQQLGYAEANPEADVEGWDAVAKVMILAQAVFREKISREQVERQGITGLTPEDIARAKKAGNVWKLIASLEKDGNRIRASVKPQEIPQTHPLAGIKGATNAVTITTDALQEVTIIGPGAGRKETGFAVLNDLLAIHRQLRNR